MTLERITNHFKALSMRWLHILRNWTSAWEGKHRGRPVRALQQCEGATGFHGWEGATTTIFRMPRWQQLYGKAKTIVEKMSYDIWASVRQKGKPSGQRFYGLMGLKFSFPAITLNLRHCAPAETHLSHSECEVAASCSGHAYLQQATKSCRNIAKAAQRRWKIIY